MSTAVAAPACPKCQNAYISDETVCRVCHGTRSTDEPARSVKPVLIVLTILALVIAAGVYLNFAIRTTEAFQDALRIALSSPAVRSELGNEIHEQYPVLGHIVPLWDSRFMEWSVRLKGPRGQGHLYAVANQVNRIWDFSRLTFQSDDHRESVELTPVRKSLLPPVPTKHVYLIPLGLVEGESLEWAPGYYKSKFGIDASVLPPLSPEAEIVDSERNQINAEACVNFLQRKYPQLARDPSAILIALTSSDIYIRSYGWDYAQNFRSVGRFAVISSARIHPLTLMQHLNHEWLNSRLEKLLTKNIAILYFDFPLTNDYTSVLSSGVPSGFGIDAMGNEIIGAKGYWDPVVQTGAPSITIFDVPGREPMWNRTHARWPLPDTTAQLFTANLGIGLFIQRKADFIFEDEPALQFSRLYRNQDERSRAFGIGGTHSFDMFLVGQMGVAFDLILDEGSRIHYVHRQPVPGQRGDIYAVTGKTDERFFKSQAIFLRDHTEIKTEDGWRYFFPYTPKALPQYVTVLTSFTDPAQRKYEMTRDSFGALLEVKSPSGKWLRFENDSAHRIRQITSSTGRSMQYEYDDGGRLVRATDSEGHVDSYTYDDRGEMLTAGHGNGKPVLSNKYLYDGYIKAQVMADGRAFTYLSFHETNRITQTQVVDPNGLETYIQYVLGGYIESLPQPPPPDRDSDSDSAVDTQPVPIEDGRSWISATKEQRLGFFEGYAACYLNDAGGKIRFNESGYAYEPRLTDYLKKNPAEATKSIEELLWKMASPPYAQKIKRLRGEVHKGKYGYLDGDHWRQAPSERLGLIEGFLYCYSRHAQSPIGTFSKPASYYVSAVSDWYGVEEDDPGEIAPSRMNAKIPDVLFKLRDKKSQH
jgi:YD repeat-containing protein